jgi:thiol:disulfide interchange protein DsbA
MYDAIWTTGELGVIDKQTGRPKKKLPSIEDVARFYERTTGVKTAAFVNASKSFAVDLKIRQAEAQIKAMQVPSTPTLVVAGKYRINTEELRSMDEVVALINFLVAKESAPAAAAAPAKAPTSAPAKAPAAKAP